MEPCPQCASPRAADGWCPRCIPAAPPIPVNAAAPARAVPAPTLDVVVGRRYGRDSTHFGPVGRVVCTLILVVIPLAVFVLGGFPYGWAFAALWALSILPWGLRDLWATSKRRVRVTSLD